jgi:integrase
MKRAARHKTGSVVFDKRRKTWNFLWWEGARRRSRQIGTLKEFPTKSAAWQVAQSFQSDNFGQPSETPKLVERDTVRALAARYEQERLPPRHSTARMYRSWLRNHILPRWGEEPIEGVQPRAVELWLRSLKLSPKSRAHVRGILHLLMEFAMWSGALEISRNPIDLDSQRCDQTHETTAQFDGGRIPKVRLVS